MSPERMCVSIDPGDLASRASRGPRYTSYPPATELRAIAADAVEAELARVRDDGPASLYVHVPFCRSLCWYCACNVIATRDTSKGERYVDTILAEIAGLAGRVGPGLEVTEVAFGGGSPNFLSAQSLQRLVEALRKNFAIQPDARLSIELDPRTTTSEQVVTLGALGFRAMSVGVQDFARPVQDAIHRHQTAAQTGWLIDHARRHGFTDVNVDIVYGLPRQTEASFAATLDSVIALAPDRIALFGYAHLPDRLPHQRLVEKAGRVLDPRERATLLLHAIERLEAAGYLHLGLDHFARPDSPLAAAARAGTLSRTFQGYVAHRADSILGIGSSSISTTPRMFWQNHTELDPWEGAINAGALPVARGLMLDEDDRRRRALIEQLMCAGRAQLDAEAERYFGAELEQLAEIADLASYDAAAHAIETTPLGRLLVRNVCMKFDAYQDGAKQRFSPTI